MLTINNNPKEVILLCDLVVTELGCTRTYGEEDNIHAPSMKQFNSSKKQLQPIDIFIHITTEYKISIDFHSIIGYFNSKLKGRYGNIISNKQVNKRKPNSR